MITDPEFHFMANQNILLAGVLFVHRGASRLLARRPRVRLTVVATAAVAAWLGAGLMLVGDNIARHVQQVGLPHWWWRGHGLVAVFVLGAELVDHARPERSMAPGPRTGPRERR